MPGIPQDPESDIDFMIFGKRGHARKKNLGKQKEFEKLQSLCDRLKKEKDFHAGVKTRMEWTIASLKERN
jgi:predicted nucleotidyltransferase